MKKISILLFGILLFCVTGLSAKTWKVYNIKELHALGVSFIRKAYGFDMLYKSAVYILPWGRVPEKPAIKTVDKTDSPKCKIKSVMSDEDLKACKS